jgi:tetratricopeptide (TPR) repeat protein
MKQTLEKYPVQPEWRLMYARMLADAEQFEEAIREFQLLLSQNPQQSKILYALGVLSIQIKRLSKAKEYFQELIRIKKRVNIAQYYLGKIAYDEKELEKAISWYKQIEEGANYFLNAQVRIASILAEQGHLDEAIEHLQNVVLKSKNKEDMLRLILFEAELLTDQERYQQALDTYNRALELKPDSTDVLYMRALLYEKMGHLKQMEQDLRHVLTLAPKNANTLNALGYSLMEYTDRYQEAYELIKQALALNPDSYYILDSMGWVLYRMGKYSESIEYLRKAQAKQNDPDIVTHLGEVLWVSGDKEAAKTVWEKALKDFPENEKLREVVQRFMP